VEIPGRFSVLYSGYFIAIFKKITGGKSKKFTLDYYYG
jgi:hypothetical protein